MEGNRPRTRLFLFGMAISTLLALSLVSSEFCRDRVQVATFGISPGRKVVVTSDTWFDPMGGYYCDVWDADEIVARQCFLLDSEDTLERFTLVLTRDKQTAALVRIKSPDAVVMLCDFRSKTVWPLHEEKYPWGGAVLRAAMHRLRNDVGNSGLGFFGIEQMEATPDS